MNEAVVFLAEVLLHELRGFPVDEFAFGTGGAAFGFGRFGGDFFELRVGIDDGFGLGADFGLRRRRFVGMSKRPFQSAMDDEIGIAADRRSEMRVLVEAEREVAERVGGIARLFQRAKHEVGNDALFGFARKFANEALIVLRRDAQIGAANPATRRACRVRGRDRRNPDGPTFAGAGVRPWRTATSR